MEEVHEEYRLKIESMQAEIEEKASEFEAELQEQQDKATETVE